MSFCLEAFPPADCEKFAFSYLQATILHRAVLVGLCFPGRSCGEHGGEQLYREVQVVFRTTGRWHFHDGDLEAV